MGQLKRNTVAFERAVEYTGNLSQLSVDARFAISNMTTEFGGIVGIFEADGHTQAFMNKRKRKEDREGGLFFRADEDAEYAEEYEIKLDQVESMVALFPSPDNVVHVDEVVGKELDGCFIGACTTAEEDLILAAVVLKLAMADGLTPVTKGIRRVTPGSVPIMSKLRKLGLTGVYEAAGFTIGAPGCSYCLGIAADVAGEGEVWLSSQNRNFRNRMGKGSIANLASAATVALSSLDMKIANPRKYLDMIDREEYAKMLDVFLSKEQDFEVVDPSPVLVPPRPDEEEQPAADSRLPPTIEGKCQVFEDNIDTDAIIPAQFMPGKDDEDLGTHCFEFVAPQFRERVAQGFDIVVAGIGFGSGSSREEAVRALMGCGVKVCWGVVGVGVSSPLLSFLAFFST
jgi:homoaconitate hydratase